MNLKERARLAIRQANECLSLHERQVFDDLVAERAGLLGVPSPVKSSDKVEIVIRMLDQQDSFQQSQRRNHRRTA